jgi:hypothetical protein
MKIQQFHLHIGQLADFPVIRDDNMYYWLVYSIAGVAIPVIIHNIVFLMQNKLKLNR